MVIPAFAVGRTQELLYYVREIMEKESLEMPVYVDSPLATRATEVYRKHPEVFDEEAWKIVHEPGGIFDFRQLHYTASAEESKALNRVKGAIIISASGMADAGRIRHHLKHNIWRPEAHVVIVGYQAPGTLGRRLLEGAQTVRLFGEDVAVKAHIHDLDSMSAHADQAQLLEWASNFKPPKLTIITHGEPESALAFQKVVEEKLDFKALVPARGSDHRVGRDSGQEVGGDAGDGAGHVAVRRAQMRIRGSVGAPADATDGTGPEDRIRWRRGCWRRCSRPPDGRRPVSICSPGIARAQGPAVEGRGQEGPRWPHRERLASGGGQGILAGTSRGRRILAFGRPARRRLSTSSCSAIHGGGPVCR